MIKTMATSQNGREIDGQKQSNRQRKRLLLSDVTTDELDLYQQPNTVILTLKL